MAATLSTLAVDVQRLIFLQPTLTRMDLRSLHQTCSSVSNTTFPILFSDLTFNLSSIRLNSLLRAILDEERRPAIASHVLTLRIIPVSFIHPPASDSVIPPRDEDLNLEEAVAITAPAQVVRALTSLKECLYSVAEFHPPGWDFESITDSLSSITSLRHLEISSSCKTVLPFDKFGALESFTLNEDELGQELADKIATTVFNNPKLTRLSIQASEIRSALVMDRIFGGASKNPASGLTYLSLPSSTSGFSDPVVLPHLMSLTTLKLGRVHLDWTIFQSAGIHLATLHVHCASATTLETLVAYLSSYSGLRSLMLSIGSRIPQPEMERLAGEFWGTALLSHTTSLEEFKLDPSASSRWCYGEESMNVLKQCLKLGDLRMLIDWKIYREEPQFCGVGSFEHLIHTASTLPQIQILSFESSGALAIPMDTLAEKMLAFPFPNNNPTGYPKVIRASYHEYVLEVHMVKGVFGYIRNRKPIGVE